MAHGKKHNFKAIESILESDDELPDTFYEAPETPAYMDDERFDKLRFDWIYGEHTQLNTSNVPKNNNNTFEASEKNVEKPKKFKVVKARKRALKIKDIFCLQSLQGHLSTKLLIWFADFLVEKDLQSTYQFRGCLVLK